VLVGCLSTNRGIAIMRLFGLVSLGLVLACAAIAGSAIHTRRQAIILLENLKRLDTNSDPSSSFNTFREKHRHQLANQECSDDFCQYVFVVKNWVLSTLHLAPPTELRARVTVFHRRLDTASTIRPQFSRKTVLSFTFKKTSVQTGPIYDATISR